MMVVRIIGMILTLAASGALGFYLASIGKFRQQELLEFKKALLILKSEIEYIAAPLPEAVTNIAGRTTAPVSDIFRQFAQSLKNNPEGETAYHLWLNAIEANKNKSFLKSADWEALEGFGKTLGYLDKQMQSDSIKFTIEYIDVEVAELQVNNEKNQRMYRGLGLIGGVLLLVVFW